MPIRTDVEDRFRDAAGAKSRLYRVRTTRPQWSASVHRVAFDGLSIAPTLSQSRGTSCPQCALKGFGVRNTVNFYNENWQWLRGP